ncbi:EamA family transporter [Desulfosediminicola sp.]|uniref:EamA family transporter n=1 Tax=Desulfosediminicola sp. TaxID=2886825 RepID=UPI003AF1F834
MKALSISCLLTSILMGAIGQVWIKKGLNSITDLNFANGIIHSYLKIFFSSYVMLGLTLYASGVFFWLYGLSKVPLSFAFPFVSLSYVLVFFLSWFYLGEHISMLRWTGLCTICLGVFIVSMT